MLPIHTKISISDTFSASIRKVKFNGCSLKFYKINYKTNIYVHVHVHVLVCVCIATLL